MTLSLDTRQRAMLAAMGVRVWQPTPAVQALARVPQADPSPVVPASPVTADIALKALPAGLAEMDWAALQNAASLCQACGLCETRQRSVFSNSVTLPASPSADWLIITDPPSEEEERRGELFVNAEGELFDAMLQALGMSRLATSGPWQ